MTVTLYGFPISTFVNVARLVLTEKGVPFAFHDLSREMGGQKHLSLHPFNRVPILDHDGFVLYETAAIATYIDDAFDGPPLLPPGVQAKARVHQWMSALSSYYYPYIAFHLGHERLIFPALGIPPDEKVVAAALPKIAVALQVMEATLQAGEGFLVGSRVTLADFFLLPTMTSLSRTPEGADMLQSQPADRRMASTHARAAERPDRHGVGGAACGQAFGACARLGEFAPSQILRLAVPGGAHWRQAQFIRWRIKRRPSARRLPRSRARR